jgi:uncharacterized membrane protein
VTRLWALAPLAYPLLVWLALTVMPPRAVTAAALVLGAIGIAIRRRRGPMAALTPFIVPVAVALLLAGILDERKLVLFVPALVNGVLLVTFARTLLRGPSLVETMARLRNPDLPGEAVAYCRRVTAVWCAFFVVNGGVILWLAVYGSLAQWSLYTGVIAYVAVGGLLALERLYRAWRFPHAALPFMRWLRRAGRLTQVP